MIALLRLAVALAALGIGAASVAAWFGFAVAAFDLFNHFQVILIGGSLVLLLLVGILFMGSAWQWPLGGLLLAGLVASAITVGPETVAAFAPRPAAPADGRPVLTLMTHNVFGLNYDMKRVAQAIAEVNPDIVALQEYFPEQRVPLDPLLRASYPYRVYCAGGKRANIAIYSRLAFEQTLDGQCATDPVKAGRTAHIVANFALADGARFAVVTTHFDWPLPIERQLQQRDAIVKALAAIETPLIIVGDFNSTPWSYAQRGFAEAAGLTRQTHGLLTWPVRFDIGGWWRTQPFLPLDQVMTRGALTVHDVHAGPQTGSDHLPVVVRFSVGSPSP